MNPKSSNPQKTWPQAQAFTLVEMLVAVAVVMLMMLMLVQLATNIQNSFTSSQGKMEQFREARAALETISRRLAQAKLNTYWDYDNPINPTNYVRRSDLRFITGNTSNLLSVPNSTFPGHAIFFQAPGGFLQNPANNNVMQADLRLEDILNTFGYYVQYLSDATFRPPFLSSPVRNRFRLIALVEPSESFRHTPGDSNSANWYSQNAPNSQHTRVLADNIIGLVFWPRLSRRDDPQGDDLTTNYTYNSAPSGPIGPNQPIRENQLPPLISVTMVAIDEKSAARLAAHFSGAPPVWDDTWFQNVSNYDADLVKVRQRLTAQDNVLPFPVEYRIFTTDIPLRASRWSR